MKSAHSSSYGPVVAVVRYEGRWLLGVLSMSFLAELEIVHAVSHSHATQ